MDDRDMDRADMEHKQPFELPASVERFIAEVVRKMRYHKRASLEIREELTGHFEDELRDVIDPAEREQRAPRLIEQFGNAGLLAVLCRRAKKRCRPLWAKVAVRSVQAVGVLLLYTLLCFLPLFVGSPSLKVDYLAWLTDRTRAGREESLNAKPYFDKAAQSLTDTQLLAKADRIIGLWPGDVNEPQRKILGDLVGRYADAFETLRKGVTKPSYWICYEVAVNQPLGSGTPEPPRSLQGLDAIPDPAWEFNRAVYTCASGYRKLAQVFHVSIMWRAWQGDVRGALEDCLVLMDFGMHLEGRGILTEQLVGIAIEGMAYDTMVRLFDRCGTDGVDLVRIQDRLTDLYTRHPTPMDVTGDRAVWLALIQRTFTDDGKGNGRVLKDGLPLVAEGWQDGVASLLLFDYPDRRQMISRIDAFLKEYQLALETAPSNAQYEERRARWAAEAQKSFLLGRQVPVMDRLVALAWRLRTGRRALLTTVAALRYAQDKSVYPATLNALVHESYMGELPVDPYSGRAFGYRRTAGGFTLYSWGENRTDDGGRQGAGSNGQPRLWMDNGDWVFWPVLAVSPASKTPVQPAMNQGKMAKYRAGAPLNHTVRVERMGSYLKLDYELIGADGKKYDLWGISEHPNLTFSVYRGDTRIGAGKFEYG